MSSPESSRKPVSGCGSAFSSCGSTTDHPIWGEHYDVARSDLLSLQDQIARSVADALKVQMTAAERQRLFRRYTENAAAYEKYLEGRSQLSRYTPENVHAAIANFEEALKVDSAIRPGAGRCRPGQRDHATAIRARVGGVDVERAGRTRSASGTEARSPTRRGARGARRRLSRRRIQVGRDARGGPAGAGAQSQLSTSRTSIAPRRSIISACSISSRPS